MYDIEGDFVTYNVQRPTRNIDIVIHSVLHFTDWDIILFLFDSVFTHHECNSL